MKRKTAYRVLLVLSVFVGLISAANADDLSGSRPNIVLVMTDDQGYGDLGCHGHPFLKTPNLDSLYRQSTRFTDFHVSPTCAPTRSALMTGLAPFKNGVTHTILERDRLALSSTTIAEVLGAVGYKTGIFGKWHLGDADPYQPHNRGFDEVFIHGAGGIGQSYPGTQGDAPGTGYFNPIIKHNNQFVQTTGYCTDIFFEQATRWIRSQKDSHAPFFAYIATNAPHGPYIVSKEYSNLYQDKCSEKAAKFYGMIKNIDDNIGRLLAKLDEWELADNTLFIFMTDNGTAAGTYNFGMKGRKGSPHEGGSRVPLFFRLPGKIQPGVDIDRLTRHYDLFPTITAIAGGRIPPNQELDGRNLIPLLKNPKAEWSDRFTFFHVGRWNKKGAPNHWGTGNTDPDAAKYKRFAVRNERWRLVGPELFDVEADPGQTKNHALQNPSVAAKLKASYDDWWKEVRPFLINENAPLNTGKPFREQFLKQKSESGIPTWPPIQDKDKQGK